MCALLKGGRDPVSGDGKGVSERRTGVSARYGGARTKGFAVCRDMDVPGFLLTGVVR
jgi:hypothetical protein